MATELEQMKMAVQEAGFKHERIMSVAEAAALGIERIRLPRWANPMDHLKIDIIGGNVGLGPWMHLYSPINLACNGRDPFSFLWAKGYDLHERAYIAYDGPLPDSEEYRKEAEAANAMAW